MKISNQYLTASFKSKGAELASLKKGELECMWQADPVYWNRHAPVLFPIVGKLKENTYEVDGKKYEMGQHGFARDQEFTVTSHDENAITFSLVESNDTLIKYPFKFELIIAYRLKNSSLEIFYEVINTDNKELPFSIGAHPAFNCPMNPDERRSDYWLEFSGSEEFITHRLIEGNFSGEKEKVGEGFELNIRDNIFDKDALVFKNLNSGRVSLCSRQKKWLTFHFEGFPYLGIWSKSSESPFLCIEPWYGLADHQDHDQNLRKKEGIQSIRPTESFSCSYRIEIH